jgi:hypothetical protein
MQIGVAPDSHTKSFQDFIQESTHEEIQIGAPIRCSPDSHTKSSRIDSGVKFYYHPNVNSFFLFLGLKFMVKFSSVL